MSTVQEIEAAIAKLPSREFLAMVDRLREKYSETWDRQIETDAASGKLDSLYARLDKENRGQPKISLDEVLDHGKLP